MKIAMLVLVLVVEFVASCGDNIDPRRAHILELPDAAIAPDSTAPACHPVDAGAGDCCRFLPDVDAARGCAAAGLPNACGDLACVQHDCSVVSIDFCGAMTDGGAP